MKPAIPVALGRYTAFTLRKRPLEDLDTWLLQVDKQTSKCESDKISPSEVQVLIFAVGLTDERMREELLIAMQDKNRSKDLTLTTTHTMCKGSHEQGHWPDFTFFTRTNEKSKVEVISTDALDAPNPAIKTDTVRALVTTGKERATEFM
ncbi:hypothetical protein FO519_002259 [Halicephalobus sp. NKZ332]|nr:hypothetical protein FO519_002259 [Halicephalobus sp. NKZ332]